MNLTCVCGHVSYKGAQCSSCGRTVYAPRTQKGKGIVTLPGIFWQNSLKVRVLQNPSQLTGDWTTILPIFARPAPSQPRHGYIDSRVVSTREELADLLAQVLKDDPKGEVLLCDFIKASYNSIWTPGSLAVGKGHDGATSGKDTITFPLAGNNPLGESILEPAGIHKDMWPYFEIVHHSSEYDEANYTFTQLRGGPAMPSVMGNFIPSPTEVRRVITADPKKYKDTGWEEEIKKATGEKGVVVWYPGGSMTGHFSIHAFAAGIPIIFDEEPPKVGDILEPTTEAKGFDPQALLRGFVAGAKLPLKWNDPKFLNLSLVALHNSTAMTGEAAGWIGFSAAVLLRYGVAALNGEARHFGSSLTPGKAGREAIYIKVLKQPLRVHAARMNRLINVFRYGKWHSVGFGGPKWACCGAATVDVFNTIQALAGFPTEENAAKVVQALNLMVNQAHNGGWWFNKFIPQGTFTEAAKGYVPLTVSCGPSIFVAGKGMDKLTDAAYKSGIEQIEKWGQIVLAPPRASSAKILYHPHVNALEISISSRLLGQKFKPLRATISKLDKDDLKLLKKCLYLVEGDDGYRLELRKENPVVIWEDESLREKAIKQSETLKLKG